ncbi:hypothetical protein MES5069_310044 [Mesorhizobium escarrei]|uniref:Uncharacterized protein n=1 Tax=Mesorhizobium escarrei TaxID=666018 RepID=A0ABN8JWT4_9HYPH|nr:hypothetical protein MES5069_310044 [Mesorhizobium escarrei]
MARYWTEWDKMRWADARRAEEERRLAVCDTDPSKLHYLWSLVQIGEACSTTDFHLSATGGALCFKVVRTRLDCFFHPAKLHPRFHLVADS